MHLEISLFTFYRQYLQSENSMLLYNGAPKCLCIIKPTILLFTDLFENFRGYVCLTYAAELYCEFKLSLQTCLRYS